MEFSIIQLLVSNSSFSFQKLSNVKIFMLNFLFTQTPLKFMVQSFWRDEAFSYLLAKKNILQIIALSAHDFTPPLYYMALHFWIKLFGISEIMIRSLSLIFFWGTCYVFYLLLKDFLQLKNRTAFLYILLFLANPLLNYFAFEARMYSLFAFLVTLSFYFLLKKNYKGYIIASVLGFYTHYFMILVLISQFMAVKKKLRSFFYLPLALFIPWILFYFSQRPVLNHDWLLKPTIDLLYKLPVIIYSGFEFQELKSVNYLPLLLPILLTLVPTIVIGWKNKILMSWSFLTPLLALAISIVKPVFLPRYFIFCAVGMLLLITYFAEKLRPVQKAVFLIVIFALTLSYNQTQIKFREKDDFRKTAGEIKVLTGINDKIYVTSELNFHNAQYYFGESKVFIYNKSFEEIPWYVGKVLIPKEKVINSLPIYPAKAFVIKDDLSYEILTSK